MKSIKKNSLVAPLIVEQEEDLLQNNNTSYPSYTSQSSQPSSSNLNKNNFNSQPSSSNLNNKKRMPSQAYRQSARNSQKLILELNLKKLNDLDIENNNNDNNNVNNKNEISLNSLTFIEKLNRIGWKTILCTLFFLSFSIGVLIGALISIHKLPKQGFYLFLAIGLLVLFPAIYAAYQVIGKFFGW